MVGIRCNPAFSELCFQRASQIFTHIRDGLGSRGLNRYIGGDWLGLDIFHLDHF